MSRLLLEARRRVAPAPTAERPPAHPARASLDWSPAAWPASASSAAPHFYRTPAGHRPRVTLLCQGLDLQQPSDATRAALALAVGAANRLRADLRLIAGSRAIDPCDLNERLRSEGLAVHGECIVGGPVTLRRNHEFERFDGELMITASWACAAALLVELPAQDLVCLLHAGDPGLADAVPGHGGAGALLARTDLRLVVCTQALQQHLASRGFGPQMQQALSFEPMAAAPADAAVPPAAAERSLMLFEVMAPIDRERFAIGLDAIEQALAAGVLDPQRWDFLFAAPGLPQVTLRQGQRPTSLDDLAPAVAWQARQRAALVLRLLPPGAALPAAPAEAAGAAGAAVRVVAAADITLATAAGAAGAAAPGVVTCTLQRESLLDALRRAVEQVDAAALRPQQPAAGETAAGARPSLASTTEQLVAGR